MRQTFVPPRIAACLAVLGCRGAQRDSTQFALGGDVGPLEGVDKDHHWRAIGDKDAKAAFPVP